MDRVRARPGGRNAQVRERVFDAVREALEAGDPDGLSIERLAVRAGVHRATIYRRWLSTAGILADLLVNLTPIDTPLPDTGTLHDDLDQLVHRVLTTIATPVVRANLHLAAGSTDPRLTAAARDYWQNLLDHTAEVVRRAQRRSQATPDIDPVAAVESLLAPIYMRLLVSRQPVTPTFATDLVTRTMRMLTPIGQKRRP